MEIRINKFLSHAGVGSRRKVEEKLWDGQFTINGEVAEPGQIIDTEKDEVRYKGKLLDHTDPYVYIALNKPLDVLSTAHDERGRKTVMDFIDIDVRVYPVGRLDRYSSGLILLTNDGDLALKLTHPRYHLPKVYRVTTQEKLSSWPLNMMSKGLTIDGKVTQPATVTKLDDHEFQITLHEGMNRQIRKMCNEVYLTVKSLRRISIGPVKLGNLKRGEIRELTKGELRELRKQTAAAESTVSESEDASDSEKD